MNFRLNVLENITNNFSDDHKVGSGGFGDVYRGVYNGEDIAVKKLRCDMMGLDDSEFVSEFSNLRKVQHRNIIRLIGYCYVSQNQIVEHNGALVVAAQKVRILCFEYMHGGSLDDHISDDSCRLEWHKCYGIIKGICDGLNHLHNSQEEPILHLDLKPDNILLDKNMIPKIADLGLSKLVASKQTHATVTIRGSYGFMPPEYINSGLVSDKFDVFSLGVIIIKIMAGNHGYPRLPDVDDEKYIELAKKYIEHVCEKWRTKLQAESGYSSDEIEGKRLKKCVEIGLKCVVGDRSKRPSVKDIVEQLEELEGEISKMSPPSVLADGLTAHQGLHAVALSWSGTSENIPSSRPGRGPLDVVIIYAFDSDNSLAWYMADQGFYWMVYESLKRFDDSCFGFIYHGLKNNNYTTEMKLVEASETKATGYTRSDWRRMACKKNMASGLAEAHKMISYRGYQNGIILLFSDGLINNSDFFDGAESYVSTSPVHTFTLGEHAYDEGLRAIAANSPGGKFHNVPVPERPNLSPYFSKLLDSIIGGTTLDFEMPPRPITGREPLDVVIIYAFDSANSLAWYMVDDGIYWIVYESLKRFDDSCFGFIYHGLKDNNYTTEMKLVEASETKATGYKRTDWRRMACKKNMASGLAEAHKMISYRGYQNGIILLFSDGLINKGDFFDGAENLVSTVPVHTFTLGEHAYDEGLHAIAANSQGGKFHNVPVPERPNLSPYFSKLLDSIIGGTTLDFEMPPRPITGREPLDVVIIYAFDSANSEAWKIVDDGIYWIVYEKLKRFDDSCFGFIYHGLTDNNYTTEMKLVDASETKATGYKRTDWRRMACTKNMASGLAEAHKMVSYRGYQNGIVLLFSDGVINKGDFFDGAENFVSTVPVHTFTLGGDAYNQGLEAIAAHSPGGKFHSSIILERPHLAVAFSKLLDGLFGEAMKN